MNPNGHVIVPNVDVRTGERPAVIGTRVFEYLRAKGISNRWLALQLGKSDSYISAIKYGRNPVSREFIDGCVRALGVPESFLFFARDERERSGDERDGPEEAA
jgi:transcriptional regulator with XRE-family HTH domain